MRSVDSLLQEIGIEADLSQPLDDPTAAQVIAILEQAVNRYRFDEPDKSVILAQQVIQIGQRREKLAEVALGTMLHADSLGQSSETNIQTAWDKLDQAARFFQQVGDDLGWARTRIGRLGLCYRMHRVDEALADTAEAERIFIRENRPDKLLALRANKATVLEIIGHYEEALSLFQQALTQAQAMGEAGEGYIAALYRNIGYAYSYLGDLEESKHYYQQAYDVDMAKGWRFGATASRIGLAYIARAQDDYQTALRHLRVTDGNNDESPQNVMQFKLTNAELDLELHRYETANALAEQAAAQAHRLDDHYYQAYALTLIGRAQIGMRQNTAAHAAFEQAEILFHALGSDVWRAAVLLQKGLVALKQGEISAASQAIGTAADLFEANEHRIDLAHARLIQAEILLHANNIQAATLYAQDVLTLADKSNLPTLKYSAQFLLGEIAKTQGQHDEAVVNYRTACETIWHIQQALTITLRPDFMSDKHGAAHALVRLLLEASDVEGAFAMVERIKAQIVLTELANRSSLRWQVGNDRVQDMVTKLDQLRAEHQYLYRTLNPSPIERHTGAELTEEQSAALLAQIAQRERAMQQLTEQLYVEAATDDHRQLIQLPDLNQIQTHLGSSTAMIVYYDDGHAFWGFTITRDTLQVLQLPLSVDQCRDLLDHLYDKMDFALDVCDLPDMVDDLVFDTQNLLGQLYDVVLHPLMADIAGSQRLLVVPYGNLHFLPFAALYNGQAYLVETHELITLPAASLVTRPAPQHDSIQARVIGHSWNGTLQSAIDEAHMVHDLCGGDLFVEEMATVSALNQPACKILHICAHGEFRIDHPDLSFIQMDDRLLFSDDLLQNDMHYELVVLSSCETGRADVAPGDELIGLGRGFLYAGAGAAITSLWQIESDTTLRLMRLFYEHLLAGENKASALRSAQCALLDVGETRHPVFWATFQLTGDARSIII